MPSAKEFGTACGSARGCGAQVMTTFGRGRAGLRLVLLDGDDVREGLQRMPDGGLHAEDRLPGILDELVQDHLVVVVVPGFEAGEGADADHVAHRAHHGNRFQDVLALVPVHHHAAAGLELPGALVHVQDDGVHPQVQGGLLGAQARAQAVVEEHEEDGLVTAERLVREGVRLHEGGLGEGGLQVAQLLHAGKMLHLVNAFQASTNCRAPSSGRFKAGRSRMTFSPEAPVKMCFSYRSRSRRPLNSGLISRPIIRPRPR